MSKESLKDSSDENLPEWLIKDVNNVCKERKLKTKQKEILLNEVKKQYVNSSFEPGEAIGIISAQSISEPATQMTMRTFHFAGSVGIRVTLGLPRLIEIFAAKKEPKTSVMTIYLKKQYNNKKNSEKIAEEITEKKLRNFVLSVSLDLTTKKIKVKLKKIKKNQTNEILSKLRKRFKPLKITLRGNLLIAEIKGKETTIKDLQKIKKKLLDLCVAGISKVKNAIVVEEGNDWVIKTSGSNFVKILNISKIDFTRSYTNNIQELGEVLGVEAARNAIIKETRNTMKQQGLDIDDRHIILVADIMTFSGSLLAMGRYGIAGMKPSILTRAGFEETIKHLVKASVRQEEDNFNAIFDNVMVNQQVPVGTGMFELIAKFGEE